MNIKFKNTYEVCVLNPSDCDIELRLSDYNTFKEFAKELKSHGIKWDKGEGCFTGGDEDEGLFFVISEKDYGATADWHHGELEEYMNKHLSKNWSEDAESTFFAPDLELEDVFNQLKKIDGVELEINDDEDYEDRDPHTVEDAQKRGYNSYDDFVEEQIKALESDWKEPEEYVDWEAVDKMLRS